MLVSMSFFSVPLLGMVFILVAEEWRAFRVHYRVDRKCWSCACVCGIPTKAAGTHHGCPGVRSWPGFLQVTFRVSGTLVSPSQVELAVWGIWGVGILKMIWGSWDDCIRDSTWAEFQAGKAMNQASCSKTGFSFSRLGSAWPGSLEGFPDCTPQGYGL